MKKLLCLIVILLVIGSPLAWLLSGSIRIWWIGQAAAIREFTVQRKLTRSDLSSLLGNADRVDIVQPAGGGSTWEERRYGPMGGDEYRLIVTVDRRGVSGYRRKIDPGDLPPREPDGVLTSATDRLLAIQTFVVTRQLLNRDVQWMLGKPDRIYKSSTDEAWYYGKFENAFYRLEIRFRNDAVYTYTRKLLFEELPVPTEYAKKETTFRQIDEASGVPAKRTEPVKRSDWPQYRGPLGTGVSHDTGVPVRWDNRNVRWKTAIEGDGPSSPITFGESVFLTSYTMKAKIGARQSEAPQELWLSRIDRRSGEVIWQKQIGTGSTRLYQTQNWPLQASSTPTVDSERVYAFFGKSGVFAFDHDGKQVWHADVGSNAEGEGLSPSLVLYKDLLLVNSWYESESLRALDKRTGKEVWRSEPKRAFPKQPLFATTPVLAVNPAGRTELVVVMNKIHGFDPESGAHLWYFDDFRLGYTIPVAHDGVVYCIGESGRGVALRTGGSGDVSKTHRLWDVLFTTDGLREVRPPLAYQDRLYWSDNGARGTCFCADMKTGALIYAKPLRLDPNSPRRPQVEPDFEANPGRIYCGPIAADGRIYYLAMNGVYVLAAGPECERLALNQLREVNVSQSFIATPAISSDALLFRSSLYLYCIGS